MADNSSSAPGPAETVDSQGTERSADTIAALAAAAACASELPATNLSTRNTNPPLASLSSIPREISDSDSIMVDTGTETPPTGGGGVLGITAALNQDVGDMHRQQHILPSSEVTPEEQRGFERVGVAGAPTETEPDDASLAARATPLYQVGAEAVASSTALAASPFAAGGSLGAMAIPSAACTAASAAFVATASTTLNGAPPVASSLGPAPSHDLNTPAAVAGDHTRQDPVTPLSNGRPYPPLHEMPTTPAGGDGFLLGRVPWTPKRRRLLRLESGELVVLPTNIYKQAGGVKLDLSLGGFRIDGEKCTLKNRAFNFGVLQGFTRDNLLALRAFRNIIVPPDRLAITPINPIAAAEVLFRYDEEHLRPPPGADPSAYEGPGGWIPDSRELHITFLGSNMEIRVKAGDLRAVDRPLQCKLALDALKRDPKVLEGTLEPAPPLSRGEGYGGSDDVGMVAGATGFARAPSSAAEADPSGPLASFKRSNPDSPFEPGVDGDGSLKQRRRKKKKSVVAEDGITYDLPTYVQNVETKQHRSTLRLKMPLNGFLVNGEETSVADLVVAYGLEVTRQNLLALRACRDAVLTNFAGPILVKRVVAAEVFHAWAKKKEANRNGAMAEPAIAAANPSSTMVAPTADGDVITPPPPMKDLAGVATSGAGGDTLAVGVSGGASTVSPATTVTPAVSSAILATANSKQLLPDLADQDVVKLAGPASCPGGPRVELQMTVGELRQARQSRLAEFKQLLMAMLNDPIVQGGELDVVAPSRYPSQSLTEHNSSGAAAAVVAAKAQKATARALEDTTRAMALLASGRERDGSQAGFVASSAGMVGEGGQTNSITTNVGLAPPQGQRLDQRPPFEWSEPGAGGGVANLSHAEHDSTARDVAGVNECGGSDDKSSGIVAEAAGAVAPADATPEEAETAASKRRRQLWMHAIRENEVRYNRRKEEARREFDAREQQLLRWMVDEEIGRHKGCGDAGPPPMVEMERGVGSCTP